MIEPVGALGLDRLAALQAACFEEAWSRDFLARLLASPGVAAWMIGDDAYAVLRVIAGEAELLSLGTRPGSRLRGHARALVAHVIALAREGGAQQLFLEVAADTGPARALYAAQGFAEVGRRWLYYHGRVDAVVMAKPL